MTTRIRRTSTLATLLLVLALAPTAQATELGSTLDIPFERFVLENGLTLIVHEDRKAPIVAVNVWYHVGSKNEPTGRTGFAHLFEHLMFNGSENFDDDYFKGVERLGATDLNGTTNDDRTNYFQNVPTNALDTILWLESDRMGHLLGAITQEKLDEQRGVVQNEKRQFENQPYSVSYELITKATFPEGHPYAHTVIGSMEDLDAAALEDVHEWFKTYYGAANAVVAVVGDIDAETAKKKVEKYFGDIPAGPPVARFDAWVPRMQGERRQTVQDRVPQARVYKVWNVPQGGEPESDYLDLAAGVLASGKTSRLYKRLVYEDQIATSVNAYVDTREIASQFQIEATAKPGEDPARIEQAIDEELARFLKDGPTEAELQRVRTDMIAGFVRGAERIGGFGGKSDILARNEVYYGDPAYYKTTLGRYREATRKQVHEAARNWLADGVYVLEVHPFPEYSTVASEIDRSAGAPAAGQAPTAKFPALQKATLSNGLSLVLAERHATPIVRFDMLVDAGYAADQFAAPGTASLAMNMLDEGTTSRSALEISEQADGLGARIGAGSNLDTSTVTLSALKENLDASLDLFADVVLNPSFPASEFERLKRMQLAGIKQEKSSPIPIALRVFPALLYGSDHAYGNPYTGSGNEAAVTKMTREDLVKFHQTWFKPNNATLVVVGDTTMAEIKPKLEALFKGWKSGKVPTKNIKQVAHRESSQVYLIDRPGSIQSIIFAGHVAPPKSDPDEIAIETMNDILGGTFTSRINMNLREDKHWSYGSRSIIVDARGQRPFIAFAPVQTDKTKESMVEVLRELTDVRKERPITGEELSKAKDRLTLQLPGSWETVDELAGAIVEIVNFGMPDDYYESYPAEVHGLTTADMTASAGSVIQPDKIVWVIVGDRSVIEPGIRDLGWGEISFLDTDGNAVN
jgi:zinc protease